MQKRFDNSKKLSLIEYLPDKWYTRFKRKLEVIHDIIFEEQNIWGS